MLRDWCIVVIFADILRKVFVQNNESSTTRMLYMLYLPAEEDLDQATGGCAHVVNGRLFVNVR